MEEKIIKMGFFEKVWNSITKIEKYPELAAQVFGKAINYLIKIVAILVVVLCIGMTYQTYTMVQDSLDYLRDDFPEFSYKDGTLNIESENNITFSAKDSILGETIIDTKTDDEQKINQYINSMQEAGSGAIVLKDRIILKNDSVAGSITYNYNDILGNMGITEFDKQNVIDYANSTQILNLYISLFLTLFIYVFVMYLLTTLSNVILLTAFGYITTWMAKIKMRYVAIFNMSVYALTLSILLNILYILVNIFIDFNIEYFQVMYISVAAIYLVAAIFILKSEFIKKQEELMKVLEEQKNEVQDLQNEEYTRKKEKNEEEDEAQENKEKEGNPEGTGA